MVFLPFWDSCDLNIDLGSATGSTFIKMIASNRFLLVSSEVNSF